MRPFRPTSLRRSAAIPVWCIAALDHLARLAGKPLAELDPARRDAVAKEFRASGGAPAATLVRVVLQCYYRDDRVLRSLGLELRAPFPKGHVLLEQATGRCSIRSRRGRRSCGGRNSGRGSLAPAQRHLQARNSATI